MKTALRGGYTTGACMAAGVKAALIYLKSGLVPAEVEITALDGTPLIIPVNNVEPLDGENGARTEIIKNSGDDPDITNGTLVVTEIRLKPEQEKITFKAGAGIGRVTKPGLSIPVGEPAINLGPRELVKRTVLETNGEIMGLEVTVSIPAGVELAKRTLNPILGVEGGLSVIGTTGVLRPMSEEGFKNSLVPQLDVAMAAGFSSLVFVPGKIGQTQALKYCLPEGSIVQTSNFIGFMLEQAAAKKVKEVLLFGHIGKLAKVAAGVFYTHNRIGDARLETMAAYGALHGLPQKGVERVLQSATTEEAMAVYSEYHLESVYSVIARRASERAMRFIFNEMKIGTVLTALAGDILGFDENALEIVSRLGGKIN